MVGIPGGVSTHPGGSLISTRSKLSVTRAARASYSAAPLDRPAPRWGRRSNEKEGFVKTRSAVIASAAAALFVAGMAGAAHAEQGGAEAKVKCEGVNSCKGHGDCKSAQK